MSNFNDLLNNIIFTVCLHFSAVHLQFEYFDKTKVISNILTQLQKKFEIRFDSLQNLILVEKVRKHVLNFIKFQTFAIRI